MALPETALGSVPPGVGATSEQPAGASGTRLKVASRPATVGATWMDLFHPGTPSPPNLEARVRVIADIAGALIQIHDNTGMPRPHRRHGRLTPRHLLVGVDGSASLFTAREPFSKLLPPQPDLGYLAPELLTQSGPSTQQSDVFSLGVLLWEALDNGRLFPHRRAAAISRLPVRCCRGLRNRRSSWSSPPTSATCRRTSPLAS
jgi:serine/threonine protein kinase